MVATIFPPNIGVTEEVTEVFPPNMETGLVVVIPPKIDDFVDEVLKTSDAGVVEFPATVEVGGAPSIETGVTVEVDGIVFDIVDVTEATLPPNIEAAVVDELKTPASI